MANSSVLIGEPAERYSELSLSVSFSGQVKKPVKLLQVDLEGIRNKSDPESIRIETNLEQLKAKLNVFKRGAAAARKKTFMPNLDGLGQKIHIIRDILGGK